ncbi:MAG: efflux RND transporter permease subunit [Candidatus Thiodiazotropha sp. (ex Lucinoma borealis)]|nr:efflux RND transporter permease subunit [Candidatus Thiodiazotropha sp. (ex Lucinoma borealis)]MCU7869242.1 efflux RND transporter permease subunit [Candidatus Thiodiazotropha sp. (ex Lucinoma borealis)]
MVITDTSIRRPVLATVMNLLLILIGVISYDRLTVREYPNIDLPVVTVETTYPGASASIMESQVTSTLEDSLAGIEGIDFMTSISRSEVSQITITFKLDRDADNAANDVRDRVGRVRGALPDDVEEPVVAKVEADAQPIIWLAMSSDRHNKLEISEVADQIVRDRLQTINGVASVEIFGERRYAMRIWLDPVRLAAINLTTQDVENALRGQNLEVPSGRIESVDREFTVLAQTDLRTPQEFGDIILRDIDGYLVRLRDVARIELGPEDERVVTRYKGETAVALGVVKQSVANPLEISQGISDLLPTLIEAIPDGMTIEVAYDSSIFIERSIEGVFTTIFEAVALVILVIFLFLRSVRATLIPMVTIPVSLIGVFAMMYALGYSINVLTLLAMVLAVGLVVDDAIVVLENIHRYIEKGLDPIKAAIKGSSEIAFAVIAMTLTLVAVFAPISFSLGRTGKLFTEFALTLAGAVLVSGFTALTLSTMMSSRLLRHQQQHNWFYDVGERVLSGMISGYQGVLGFTLKLRWLILFLAVGVGAGCYLLYSGLQQELAPIEDRSFFMTWGMAPQGSTVDYTNHYSRQMEAITATVPEVNTTFTVVGFPVVTETLAFSNMKFWEERDRPAKDITSELTPKLYGGVTGLMGVAINPPPLGQSPINKNLEVVIQTTGSYKELDGLVQKVMARARENQALVFLDNDLKLNKPELKVNVNRDKAAATDVSIDTVGRTLETMLGGRKVTRFKRGAEQYDVIVQIEDEDRRDPNDLNNIYVRGRGGEMIQLANLVSMEEGVAPKELNHFDKLRAAVISANLAPGYSLGEAISFMEQQVEEVAEGKVQLRYKGETREFKESGDTMMFAFILALGFIYLVLAAQFESFIDPFIILISVPLAIGGALLALTLTGGTLNIYSQIGMITLVGLITKHGILIVEFANQIQRRGSEKIDAVIEAASLRLRPILMTTAAMVLGAIPLALASGAGAEGRQQIGWVIVGGMSIGTLFTLFVVPVVYSLIARTHESIEGEETA